jgi:hypothetical protein
MEVVAQQPIKMLRGIEEICQRFGWTKSFLRRLIEIGLPVRKVGQIWVAHEDNIDDFLKAFTSRGEKI